MRKSKMLKRITSVILTATMLFSLGTTVFASGIDAKAGPSRCPSCGSSITRNEGSSVYVKDQQVRHGTHYDQKTTYNLKVMYSCDSCSFYSSTNEPYTDTFCPG